MMVPWMDELFICGDVWVWSLHIFPRRKDAKVQLLLALSMKRVGQMSNVEMYMGVIREIGEDERRVSKSSPTYACSEPPY